MNKRSSIRPSPIAGRWYSNNPQQLATEIDGYINSAKLPEITGQIVGVMAPHAGYVYSGPTAGYAFAALRGKQPEIIAVISPSHEPYRETILTTSYQAFLTPLGEIPVDLEALNKLDLKLKERVGFGLERIENDREHSLEIELPFLQRIIETEFILLPIMVWDTRHEVIQALGEILAEIISDRSSVLVASTDLSHYKPVKVAEIFDHEMLRQVENFDPQGVLQTEEQGRGFACGRGALAAVMWATKALGANKAQLLHYATSGDAFGDYNNVVGYGAAAFIRNGS
jgi:AmmeMemoRadiSam system protein B